MTKALNLAPTQANIAELASLKRQSEELVEFLTNTPCKTAVSEAWFSQQLSNVRALEKRFDEERTSMTKPLLDTKRRIDAQYGAVLKPLKECEDIIRGKLASAALGRLERERAALQLAQEAAATGDTDKVMDALAAVPEAVTTTGSSVKIVYEVATVDFAMLPDEYKTIDHAKLAGVGLAAKDEPSVAGVTWRQVGKVRAK